MEEARAITMKPLAILPPQEKESRASHRSMKRSIAPNGRGKVKVGRTHLYKRPTTGALGLKKKLLEDDSLSQ